MGGQNARATRVRRFPWAREPIAYAVGSDDLRPQYSSLLITVLKGELPLASTSSYRNNLLVMLR